MKNTKRCLTFIIKDSPISEEALATFLTKVEATQNIRPLKQLSDDKNYFNVFTPNHFVLRKKLLHFNPEMTKDNHV